MNNDSCFIPDYAGMLDVDMLRRAADGIEDPQLRAEFHEQMTITAARIDDMLLMQIAGRTGQSFSEIMYGFDRDEAYRMNHDLDAARLAALIADLPKSRDTVPQEDPVVQFLMSFEKPAVDRDPSDALRDLRRALDIVVHEDRIEFASIGISMRRRHEERPSEQCEHIFDIPGDEYYKTTACTVFSLDAVKKLDLLSFVPTADEWRSMLAACPGASFAERQESLVRILELPKTGTAQSDTTGRFEIRRHAHDSEMAWCQPIEGEHQYGNRKWQPYEMPTVLRIISPRIDAAHLLIQSNDMPWNGQGAYPLRLKAV